MSAMTRDELLTAYAAGTTSPGLSLLCAAYVELDADAAALVAGLETVGGALLQAEASDAAPPMDFAALLARLDDDAPTVDNDDPEAVPDGPLPAAFVRATGLRYDAIPWRRRLPGIAEHAVSGFAGEKVSLLRARPGATIPQHTHEGGEATLVLTGALRDGDCVFRTGGLSLAGPEHDHHPEIIGDDVCICLAVRDGALRFTGRFGRALNMFTD